MIDMALSKIESHAIGLKGSTGKDTRNKMNSNKFLGHFLEEACQEDIIKTTTTSSNPIANLDLLLTWAGQERKIIKGMAGQGYFTS